MIAVAKMVDKDSSVCLFALKCQNCENTKILKLKFELKSALAL